LGYSLLAEREPENTQLERLVNMSRWALLLCIEAKECGRRFDIGEETDFDPEYDEHFIDSPSDHLGNNELSGGDTSDTDWDDHDFSDGPWPLSDDELANDCLSDGEHSDDELSDMSDDAVKGLLTTL
jgi:hypothetical protein